MRIGEARKGNRKKRLIYAEWDRGECHKSRQNIYRKLSTLTKEVN